MRGGSAARPPSSRQPHYRWRGRVGSGVAGVGANAVSTGHCGGAEREGGSSGEPDQRDGAGNAVSGAHFVTPLVEDVVLFDTRDQVFHHGVGRPERPRRRTIADGTSRSTGEGRADLGSGDHGALPPRSQASGLHQNNLPHPVEKEIVPPTVASVWREIWCRTTRCAMFFRRSARKCGSGRRG